MPDNEKLCLINAYEMREILSLSSLESIRNDIISGISICENILKLENLNELLQIKTQEQLTYLKLLKKGFVDEIEN